MSYRCSPGWREEEAWCEEALALLEMVADNRSALLMLDKRYGEKAEP